MEVGASVAENIVEVISKLDAPPGSADSLGELTERLDNAAYLDVQISPAAAYAVAIYIGVLALSLCAWFYAAHPDVAGLMLDASGPVSWSVWVGRIVLHFLRPGGKSPEDD